MRPLLDYPYCPGQVPETEANDLWDYPRWAKARMLLRLPSTVGTWANEEFPPLAAGPPSSP